MVSSTYLVCGIYIDRMVADKACGMCVLEPIVPGAGQSIGTLYIRAVC